jgi:SsrA-binding protein
MAAKKSDITLVAENRKARHDYFIEESFEAGIALVGTEVKSCRSGKINLRDSHAAVDKGEVWLYDVHISPYDPASRWNHEPTRRRKLLLHRREIMRLVGKLKESGYTLVPLSCYFNAKGKLKVSLGLARGKKQHDKRASIAERDAKRQLQRVMRGKMDD